MGLDGMSNENFRGQKRGGLAIFMTAVTFMMALGVGLAAYMSLPPDRMSIDMKGVAAVIFASFNAATAWRVWSRTS